MVNQPTQFIKRALYEVNLVLLTLVALIVFPCVVLLFLPIYACRYIVSHLSRWFRPDLAKMIVTRSSIMAVDDWTRAPRCNLVLSFAFQGELQMDRFQREIDEKVIQKRNENGVLLHPEMQQYFKSWLGFLFWTWEKDFHVSKHISYFDADNPDRVITTADATKIENELIFKPHPPKMSPWEVIVFRNYQPDHDQNPGSKKTFLIFRLHHGIADGYSLLNLLLKEICQLHGHEYALPNYSKKTLCQRVLNKLAFALKSPYEGVKQAVECNDVNEWRIPRKQMSSTWYQVRSDPIRLELLKELKRMYKVSFTAVMVGGISGGIRNYLQKRGMVVPEVMHCIAPFPVPGHTKKLRNFYAFAFIKFPVGIADPKARMEMVEKNIKALKKSTTPLINFMQLPLLGGLFSGMIKTLARNEKSTAIMSNFPGPFDQCTFMDLPVTEIGFAGGLLHGNQGLGFGMLSYLGFLTIRIAGCQSLFPKVEDLESLLQEIVLEFMILRNSEQV